MIIIRDNFYLNKSSQTSDDIKLKDGLVISKIPEPDDRDALAYNFAIVYDYQEAIFIKDFKPEVRFHKTFYNETLKNLIFKLYTKGVSPVTVVDMLIEFKRDLLNSNNPKLFIFTNDEKVITLKNSKVAILKNRDDIDLNLSDNDKLLILNRFYIKWFEPFI